MKKIISLIATAALALGFVSCSGDLHDDVKKPIDLSGGYYLVGSMTGSWSNKAADVVAFESNGDGTYKVPFSADAAEIAFAFIPKADSWDGQIGGDKMTAGTLPSGAKFESKDNGNGGKNGTISGLEANGKYKLVVTPLDNGTLKIDCSSNVPPTPTYLQNMYVRGGMIDWAVTLAGSLLYDRLDEAKGEVYYHVDFTCTDVSKNEYAIANSDWSKYTAANITVDGDYVKTTKGSSDNNKITGLVANSNYRIYVKTTSAGDVYTKVETIVSYTISFALTGADKGVEYYINGSPFGWSGGWPIISWSNNNATAYEDCKKAATGRFATADADGNATFTKTVSGITKAGETLAYQIKIVSCTSDGADPKWTSGDNNVSFDVTVKAGETTVIYDVDKGKVTVK